jgi:hypothetical protein
MRIVAATMPAIVYAAPGTKSEFNQNLSGGIVSVGKASYW